jgi:hypothetical protein
MLLKVLPDLIHIIVLYESSIQMNLSDSINKVKAEMFTTFIKKIRIFSRVLNYNLITLSWLTLSHLRDKNTFLKRVNENIS